MAYEMELKSITEEGMSEVVSWCQNTDAAFLRQWTGKNYEYPITVGKMKTRYACINFLLTKTIFCSIL